MAGVKGRSGGARPNSGPKKKPPVVAPYSEAPSSPDDGGSTVLPQPVETPSAPVSAPVEPPSGKASTMCEKYVSPLQYLESVYMDNAQDVSMRIRAAAVAANFVHKKKDEVGKKVERAEKADAVGAGTKFTPGRKPTLRAVGGA